MIWLVGNKGMLGIEVEKLLREQGVPYIASDREIDITQDSAPAAFLDSNGIERLDWVINCAAYTDVERAEHEPDRAFSINERGVRILAAVAQQTGAALVHVSTDYVFDGTKDGPYMETDQPNPISIYGKSKLAGERILQDSSVRFVIMRSAWLFGTQGKNFVATMLRLFQKRNRVSVVNDQWGNPTYAPDLASAILEVLVSKEPLGGIFHFANNGRTTWYEFAREIYRQACAQGRARPGIEVVPIGSSEYPSVVRRPANSTLSKEKIQATLGIAIRKWQDALNDYLTEDRE
jgi:dTDP-4-dehydrorhamnose reductase